MISLNDLLSPLNGVVSTLLLSRLHFLASKGLLVLSWSGRKSGRRFSVPAGYQEDDDAVVVMISKRDEKNWWKNFQTPWPADLYIRGKLRSALGEVVPIGSAEFFSHCERTLERLPWMGSQFGGIQFDRVVGLTEEQRTTLSVHVGIVRFELVD